MDEEEEGEHIGIDLLDVVFSLFFPLAHFTVSFSLFFSPLYLPLDSIASLKLVKLHSNIKLKPIKTSQKGHKGGRSGRVFKKTEVYRLPLEQ